MSNVPGENLQFPIPNAVLEPYISEMTFNISSYEAEIVITKKSAEVES